MEHVLVVPTAAFTAVGHFQGLCTQPQRYLEALLQPDHVSYQPRDKMEHDVSFKQIIPYCIFRWQDQIFNYVRGIAQGESRLHRKRSLGIGGHVTQSGDTPFQSYAATLLREIAEEVYVDVPYTTNCMGLLNDDQTEVGKVHLGIVHICELEAPAVRPRESGLLEPNFAPLCDLVQDRLNFETWAQICFDNLL